MSLKKLLPILAIAFSFFMPAADASERSVALVLDASGSMNGKLGDGSRKIAAAKTAVRDLVGRLPGDVRLSFRAYGHQSPRSANDCKDTQLLVGFGAADQVRDDVIGNSDNLSAQGYTPITYVLGLAADDLKPEPGKKLIVLVSDGKETCEGDPCVLAQKLADADADLTIHTVGFGVDAQARLQLQCIANAARGQYFDANSAGELADTMTEAVQAEIEEEVIIVTVPVKLDGKLEIINPYYNEVVDAETGEQVAKLTDSDPVATLPPGIYNIQFGKNLWLKSVAVVGGETTVINPGRLQIENPYYTEVLEPETGVEVEKATEGHSEFPLLAGRYDIAFGKAIWRGIEILEGETTVLRPARLHIERPYYTEVFDAETGVEVIKLTDSTPEQPLPPGTYDVQFGNAIWHGIELTEGETTFLRPARLRIEGPYYNKVLDAETGAEVIKLTDGTPEQPLPPGTYDVHFGKAIWRGIVLTEGETTVLNPGRIKIEGKNFYINVLDEDGNKIFKMTEGTSDIPFPPGKYTLDISGQIVPVTLSEGKRMVIKIQ